MTYCVAIRVDEGLVLLADTRTNAGVDNLGRFSKLFLWDAPDDRAIALMTAGNLSITQGVISRLNKAIERSAADPTIETILSCDSMFRAAELVGEEMRALQSLYRDSIQLQGTAADATILLAGQRKGGLHRLFMLYSAGNFIEATDDSCFFQIGEHKYGKPILDRVVRPDTSLADALKAACVSMDSTLRSNLSVGMPLDLAVIDRDALTIRTHQRIEAGDPRFQRLSARWSDALRIGFQGLPDLLDEM